MGKVIGRSGDPARAGFREQSATWFFIVSMAKPISGLSPGEEAKAHGAKGRY
jgi:hypothetical protein